MRVLLTTGLVTAALLAAHGQARADGYCDYVEGVAEAQSALLFSPSLFGSFGYVDQPIDVAVPDDTSNDLRLTAGVQWSLGGIYEGILTRKRGKAACARHEALDQIGGHTTYKALTARAKVLEDAMAEAEKLLADANEDLDKRRATAQDVMATRLRVDELREMAATTTQALAELPPPVEGRSMARALASYYRADADVEKQEGRLRSAQAWDVSVRVGYDKFLGGDDESPYVAIVSASFNVGWLLQGRANKKAAEGRRRAVQKEHGSGDEVDTTVTRMRGLLESETVREEETGILLADLDRQLDDLRGLGGEASRRYRQTVWFEWVKIKAEHEYHAAHVASLREVLGEETE